MSYSDPQIGESLGCSDYKQESSVWTVCKYSEWHFRTYQEIKHFVELPKQVL